MKLLSRYLKQEVPTLHKNNVRLQYIGRLHELPEFVQEKMEWAREDLSRNTGMLLTLALNYSARSEIVDAFRRRDPKIGPLLKAHVLSCAPRL